MSGKEEGGLAQLGEHLPCKQGVESSNLLVSIDSNEQCGQSHLFLSIVRMHVTK